MLEGFRSQCCFNVDSAEKIIREVWTRLDQGIEWTDWKAVVEDLEMKILYVRFLYAVLSLNTLLTLPLFLPTSLT